MGRGSSFKNRRESTSFLCTSGSPCRVKPKCGQTHKHPYRLALCIFFELTTSCCFFSSSAQAGSPRHSDMLPPKDFLSASSYSEVLLWLQCSLPLLDFSLRPLLFALSLGPPYLATSSDLHNIIFPPFLALLSSDIHILSYFYMDSSYSYFLFSIL